MNLRIIEDRADIAGAEKKLQASLRSALRRQGKLNIGYPGGNHDYEVYAAGPCELYYAYSPPRNEGVSKHWNSFGVFRPEASRQEIAVEINVPVEGDDARVSAFFARDARAGRTYLMHDGGLGGGRAGVGQGPFLAFVGDRVVEAQGSRRSRSGLLIADLDDPGLPTLVWRFVQKARDFKLAVRAGTAPAPRQNAGDPKFTPEFRGRKRGRRSSTIDYETYHGLVVDQLKATIETGLARGARVASDSLVDLFVWKSGRTTQVYEVKTSADRQCLYTAIGQLLTHGRGANPPERILVLPQDGKVPPDCAAAMRENNIRIRRFSLNGSGVDVSVTIQS